MTFADSKLARLFDAHAVAEALVETRGLTATIDKAEVADVRYRPGRPCWLLYRFKIRQAGERKAPWRVFAARHPADHDGLDPAPAHLDRCRDDEDVWLQQPVARLAAFDLVLFAFPVDGAMPTLVEALSAEAVQRDLARAWAGRHARVRDVRVRLLGYTPWARAALEYDVIAEVGGWPESRQLIGKMHAMKPAARRFADAWAVWQAARGRVGLAPPAGYLGSMGVTLQDRVRGVRLGGLVQTPRFTAAVRRTARQLARLHHLCLPLATRRSPADEAATVHRWAALLATIRPDLEDHVHRLRDRIAAELDTRVVVLGPVHADFHHTNVLVDDGRITFIDLDEMAFGDPLVDVGRFLASLRIPSLRAFGTIDALADAREEFVAAYLASSQQDVTRVRLFEAAALFIAAASAFRIQRPNWVEETDILLAETERIAALATTRRVAVAGAAPGRPGPPVVETRRWIEDDVYMLANLDPAVREVFGAELTGCRAELAAVSEPGHVRFRLSGWKDGARWRRTLDGTLGVERGGHAVIRRVRALRDALPDRSPSPRLPTPVVYLKRLGLLVWDRPRGTSFAALLKRDESDAAEAASVIGRSLAALHGTKVELDGEVLVDDELRRLARALARADGLPPGVRGIAETVSEAAARSCRKAAGIRSPILRRLAPRDILYDPGGITLLAVDRMAVSQPLFDVGDLLARLTMLEAARGPGGAAADAARRFRTAYLEATTQGIGPGLAGFEAAALVRHACQQLRADGGRDMACRLIERAAERLDLAPEITA